MARLENKICIVNILTINADSINFSPKNRRIKVSISIKSKKQIGIEMYRTNEIDLKGFEPLF